MISLMNTSKFSSVASKQVKPLIYKEKKNKIKSFIFIEYYLLTHNRPAMPFSNRKLYFRKPFQFSIVTIPKISPGIQWFRHIPKL